MRVVPAFSNSNCFKPTTPPPSSSPSWSQPPISFLSVCSSPSPFPYKLSGRAKSSPWKTCRRSGEHSSAGWETPLVPGRVSRVMPMGMSPSCACHHPPFRHHVPCLTNLWFIPRGLSSKRLTGTIPESIGNLVEVQYMYDQSILI